MKDPFFLKYQLKHVVPSQFLFEYGLQTCEIMELEDTNPVSHVELKTQLQSRVMLIIFYLL